MRFWLAVVAILVVSGHMRVSVASATSGQGVLSWNSPLTVKPAVKGVRIDSCPSRLSIQVGQVEAETGKAAVFVFLGKAEEALADPSPKNPNYIGAFSFFPAQGSSLSDKPYIIPLGGLSQRQRQRLCSDDPAEVTLALVPIDPKEQSLDVEVEVKGVTIESGSE